MLVEMESRLSGTDQVDWWNSNFECSRGTGGSETVGRATFVCEIKERQVQIDRSIGASRRNPVDGLKL